MRSLNQARQERGENYPNERRSQSQTKMPFNANGGIKFNNTLNNSSSQLQPKKNFLSINKKAVTKKIGGGFKDFGGKENFNQTQQVIEKPFENSVDAEAEQTLQKSASFTKTTTEINIKTE